jgi:MFS family permease
MTENAVAEQPRERGVVGSFFHDTGQSMGSVFGNANLRRLQLAFAGSLVGNWAYATAVAVWAYGVGGAKAVGIFTAVRLALMAVTSPLAATLADRYSRKLVMIGADLYCATLVTAAAVCLYLHTPAWPVFVLATFTSFGGAPFRAAQAAMTPSLARTTEELTASNGTASTLESLAIFVGPAIGATLLTVASVPSVFLFNALSFLWSVSMVSRIRVGTADEPNEGNPPDAVPESDKAEAPAKESFFAETSAGFRTIWRDKDLRVSVIEGSAQTIVAGATAVFPLVMAVEILEVGAKGVGWLDSASGIAAVFGGIWAISRASKHALARDMTLGVVLWSLPLLLVTVWPSPVAAFAAMAVLGFANPLVDVNLFTIVQRLTPDEVLGRVFGALEACLIATMAIGAAVTPLLLHWFGLRTTLAILGLGISAVAVAGLPRMRHLDHRLVAPAGLSLLQGVPMFGPLNPVVLEALARGLVRVEAAAGDVVMRIGDESDRFYVIESGEVQVTAADGHVFRHEGPGDYFGEIGLLRDVPRTATVTALEDSVLLALPREEFLEAVTGQGEARRLADDVISRRLRA